MERDVCDSNLLLNEAAALITAPNVITDNEVGDDAISSTTSDKFVELASSSNNCDAEADFLEAELSMSNIQGEKITENVEDIVQDLENLLGESTNEYHFESSRNESCTEINSTQELQTEKLYETIQSELEVHLSSQVITSVKEGTDESSIAGESQESGPEISCSIERELKQSDDLEAVNSYIPENVGIGVPENIDGKISGDVHDISAILESDNAVQSGISEVCEFLNASIPAVVNNELSEVVAESNTVDSTEKVIEAALQMSTDISEYNVACENIQMEVDTGAEQINEQNEDIIAVASIMQEVGEPLYETVQEMPLLVEEPVPAVASIMQEVGESVCQIVKEIPTVDAESIPDTSIEVTPSLEPLFPQKIEKKIPTELNLPLMVDVEEPSSDNPNKEEKEDNKQIINKIAEETDRIPLKMTITKSENVHSILKIYDPTEVLQSDIDVKPQSPQIQEFNAGKAIPSVVQTSKGLSPLKITIQNIRNDSPICISPVTKSSETYSPKITIKPIVRPDYEESILKSVLEDKLTRDPDHPNARKILQSQLERSKFLTTPSEYILKDEKSMKLTTKPVIKVSDDYQEKYSPKITIKPIVKPPDQYTEEEKSAKITIKPIPKLEGADTFPEERNSPKIIIKPIRKPEESHSTKVAIKPILHEDIEDMKPSPKITIKPIMKPVDDFEGAMDNQKKVVMKPVLKSTEQDLYPEERHSPKITIKPILKHDEYQLEEKYTKITIKPVTKTEMNYGEGRHSPKITIKPIKPPEDVQVSINEQHSSKLIIKPILSTKQEEPEEKAPRITIKPVLKPSTEDYLNESSSNPRITIKPVMKLQDSYDLDDSIQGVIKRNIKSICRPAESSLNPKISIKPVPKQEPQPQMELIDFEEQIKQERIVLKIPKNRKNENERVNKIKVKLSKEQGIAQILPVKRLSTEEIKSAESKYMKKDDASELSITLIPNAPETSTSEVVENTSDINIKKAGATVEEDIIDPLAEIPVFEITLESAAAMNTIPKSIPSPSITVPPAPRKRGRPRKVPLEVREEFKDPKDESILETTESSRPKRSCRGTSVRATLGIRARRPRGGTTRGRVGRPPGSKTKKDRRTYNRRSKDTLLPDLKDFEVKHGDFKNIPLPIDSGNNVVIYEEETRMSAENSSRAHTPAKQVLTESIDESQSSIQSNTTTESGEKLQKIRKGPRLEVHQEPEGEVISADKLAEYSWGGGGPFMLQEQVAQFLGIKSFKRKYPGIQRRPVDMQERDFIRESCLASEAMCDMGLTAVKSEDILDIMYTDFQHKYEEYCKHQRDRQAKDVSNKQKALSLAASQEKNKLDIVEQAVQSAFQWNANFNKARKEQRRACLDLQTFTVHFPKGKMKQINKSPLGLYPVALVPGQYSDYYKKYTPLELNRLPLNTVTRKFTSSAYQDTEDSQSDASGSDSDSTSSDSDSSYSGSSVEDCKMCGPMTPLKRIVVH